MHGRGATAICLRPKTFRPGRLWNNLLQKLETNQLRKNVQSERIIVDRRTVLRISLDDFR